MKKTRLSADYSYDFNLLGMTSVAKEYKLAWSINKALGVNLKKENDIAIEFLNDVRLVISNYLHQSENSSFRLLKNKSVGEGENAPASFLVPEMKNFDFLLVIRDETGSVDAQDIASKISKLDTVGFVAKIDTDKLKSRENLIFE
jgi:hypothetical protein